MLFGMSDRYAKFESPVIWLLGLVICAMPIAAEAQDVSGDLSKPTVEPAEAAPAAATQAAASQPADDAYRPGRKPFSLTGDTSDAAPNPLSELLAIVVVILLLGGVAWFVLRKLLPRWRVTGTQRQVQVLETTHLNPRQTVVLLKVGSKRLLVAATRERVSMLADVTDAQTDESTDFAETLSQADDAIETREDA